LEHHGGILDRGLLEPLTAELATTSHQLNGKLYADLIVSAYSPLVVAKNAIKSNRLACINNINVDLR